MILCISMLSVVISPFSFPILLIWFFSFFFLMSLASGFSILFIFLRNQFLILLIFAIVSCVSFSFISALCFMIYFLLLTLGFCIFSFSLVILSGKFGYLFDVSLVSWGKLVMLWTFLLALLLLNPIGFGLSCFHFHLFLCIFWFLFVICELFRSVLFSLHLFVFLIVFFPVVDI